MKKVLFSMVAVLLICMLITACGTEKVDNSEQITSSDQKEGKIENKTVVEDNYQISRDIYGLVKEKRMSEEFDFSDFELDAKGNIISSKVSGSNTHTVLYEYDDNGRLVKSTKQTAIYGTEEQNWSYDDKGHLIEMKLIDTDRNGESSEKIDTYNYDDNGFYISGTRTTNGGDVFDISVENDEMGRIINVAETNNGEPEYVYTYSYEDGEYNPSHRTEESSRSKYEIDVKYDDQGRISEEYSTNQDGSKSTNEFTYDVVGTISESPESNPVLLPGESWVYFDNNPFLPIPTSCVASITKGDDENTFYLPTYKGTFYPAFGQPFFYPYILESSNAFTAIDQYINILSDVLGLDIQKTGTVYKVSLEEQPVADIQVEIKNGKYIMTVISAE